MSNDPASQRDFTCAWKYFDKLTEAEQRGHIKVRAYDLPHAIVAAKKAVFLERGLSASRVEIVTIEEDFL